MSIKKEILDALKKTEEEYKVKILYACESGSRGWGIGSVDSDYDVRFIYAHDPDWYLSISERRDVIELPVNEVLDIGGWDFRKTLRLVGESNAVIWEWMQSPIVYINTKDFLANVWNTAKEYYSLKKGCYHYLSLAGNISRKYLTGEKILIKKYFYILRPILAAKWICEKKEIPPMEFDTLKTLISKNEKVTQKINSLLKSKEKATEKDFCDRDYDIDDFIQKEFERCGETVQTLPGKNNDFEPLNSFFRKQLTQKVQN